MVEPSIQNPNSLESSSSSSPVIILSPSSSPPVIILPSPSSSSSSPTENPKPIFPKPNFSFPRPAVRITTEFDSDSPLLFNKLSCKFFDCLAKFKLSFLTDKNGSISDPQLGLVTKYLSLHYDIEEKNAFVKSSFDVGKHLQFRAAQDVKSARIGEPKCFRVGFTTASFCMSCACDDRKSIISCINFGSFFLFKYHHREAQQGEVAVVANLGDPGYKLEVSSSIPATSLPKATFRFPLGEVSLEEREKEEEEVNRVLSVSGIVKGQLLKGLCTAQYMDNDLNLRYSYKDAEMTIIPSISLPSNVMSLAFKRRFGPSDKLSYLHHFDSNYWSAVYKHTAGKDLKFKAGYDSSVRLGWASFWFGDEVGTAKLAPMKMKAQLMLQVPQDDIKSPVVMLKLKKRWDI